MKEKYIPLGLHVVKYKADIKKYEEQALEDSRQKSIDFELAQLQNENKYLKKRIDVLKGGRLTKLARKIDQKLNSWIKKITKN